MQKFLSSSLRNMAMGSAFVLALVVPSVVKADSISGTYRISGGVTAFDPNSITFDNTNDTATTGKSTAGTTVPGVSSFQDVTMIGVLNFNNAVGQKLFTTTNPNNGVTFSFTITSLTVGHTGNSSNVADFDQISGYGIYSETGYTSTQGSFSLVTNTNSGISFTLNGKVPDAPTPQNSTAPEPSSLILLGTGLVGAAGVMMRRRRNGEPALN